MTNKICSLHIGVSYVNEQHYGTSLIPLPCCIKDAEMMHGVAQYLNYDQSQLLVNEQATVENVKKAIKRYSKELGTGDLCVITYSGHGSKIPDLNNDELTAIDQTWCLYDRQLIDDELPYLWKQFKEGVNVLVILDSCHSGTGIKDFATESPIPLDYSDKYKSLGIDVQKSVYENNNQQYNEILTIEPVEENEVSCSVTLLAACQDNEEALAGSFVSYFTGILIKTLARENNNIQNYQDFYQQLKDLSKTQKDISPNLLTYGADTDFFTTTKPFIGRAGNYPEGVTSLFTDLFLYKPTLLEEGLNEEGLLVDFVKEDRAKNTKALNEIEKGKKQIFFKQTKESTNSEDPLYHIELTQLKSINHPWDRAYYLYDELKLKKTKAFVEPAFIFDPEDPPIKATSEENKGFLKNWPSPSGTEGIFSWHHSKTHSELEEARNWIEENIPKSKRKIRIAHIDTGYVPGHPALPEKLGRGYSFIKGEADNRGIDKIKNRKLIEQDYHGLSTICWLAGQEVPPELAYGQGNTTIGAIPFATVYPLRISDSVSLILFLNNTLPFIKAIEKAIALKCEVISISMGGVPVKGWEKAINNAYESGITIVAAAGNSFVKGITRLLPKKILYPARYDRVIAAGGITHNQYPYIFAANPHEPIAKSFDTEFMQGNYGPEKAMKTAIAAFTPNIPRAFFDENEPQKPIISPKGGGTSAATPQIAAAAALWLIKNRKELEQKKYAGTWRQVEAVKFALFNSANKAYAAYEKYYGNGSLQAMKALEIPVPKSNQLKKAKKARRRSGLISLINTLILRKSKIKNLKPERKDSLKAQMILQEIRQILELDPLLNRIYRDIDLEEDAYSIDKEQFSHIVEAVKQSPYASQYLKSMPKL